MSFEMQQREKEGIVILDLKGHLTVGDAASRLRETLRGLAAAGSVNVVLNMEAVDYIDSTGLGSLVVCFTSLRKAGGKLKLLNVSGRNSELLVLTKLATIFEMFTDEQDAVNSFFPHRGVQRFDILTFVQEQKKD